SSGASAQDDLLDVLRALYLSHADVTLTSLHTVAELLMDHDENLAVWRHQHMLMAGREIGRRPGTGGSEGMAYLDTTLAQRLYPVLWEVRSIL
ncbi:MAG TPA: tryptophan 2,3-dioxygenase family protein, partial [Acidimicrobiales bacterium]